MWWPSARKMLAKITAGSDAMCVEIKKQQKALRVLKHKSHEIRISQNTAQNKTIQPCIPIPSRTQKCRPYRGQNQSAWLGPKRRLIYNSNHRSDLMCATRRSLCTIVCRSCCACTSAFSCPIIKDFCGQARTQRCRLHIKQSCAGGGATLCADQTCTGCSRVRTRRVRTQPPARC